MEDEEYFKNLKEKANEKDKPQEEKKEKKGPIKTIKPYGFHAFLYLGGMDGWFYFSIILVVLVIVTICLQSFAPELLIKDKNIYLLSICGGLAAASMIWVMMAISFSRFKGWKEKLPFKITGVENFLAKEKGSKGIRLITITVTPKTKDKKHQAIIDDALKIIVNHFEPWRLKKASGSWYVIDKLCIKGPAHYGRMRWILKFIKKEFVEIHKRLDCIEKIHFTSHSGTLELMRDRRDRDVWMD